MRIQYISVDGRMRVDKTKNVPRLIEMPDGYHPVTNDSVWQDAERRREPLLVIIQGVRAPLGGTMETEDVSGVLYEIELAERAFRRPRVSKMWMRVLEAFVEFMRTKALYIGVVIMILYFAAEAMLGGS